MYYLTTFVNQESWSSFLGWFWLTVSHEAVGKMTSGGVVIWKLDRCRGATYQNGHSHACWRLIRDLGLSPGRPLQKAVGMSSKYISCFPQQWPKEEKGRSHSVCHYLVSDVRHSHFRHILFIRSNSLTQPTLKRRGISFQYLKGRISPDWWTCLQATAIGLGGHLLYLTLKYSISIPHGCCQKIRGFE